MMAKVLKVKEVMPTSNTRRFFYKLISSKQFDAFITISVFINTIIMAIRYYDMNPTYSLTLDVFNYIFAFIFNVECVFKIIGLGKKYFGTSWNRFDFIIVIGTDVGLLMTFIKVIDLSAAATVIRGIRIMRVFRIIKSAKNIRIILDTLVNIIPQIGNVMSLIFLLIYIFATLGVNLFSGVMPHDQITERANF
jgi:hypothetical protein